MYSIENVNLRHNSEIENYLHYSTSSFVQKKINNKGDEDTGKKIAVI